VTLGDLILRNARLTPHGPAIVYEGRALTYRAYAERSMRLANALYKLGVRGGDRVAILAQNCPEYLEVYGAGEIAGWATVTVNFRLAVPEIDYVLSDSRPVVLIFESQFADRVAALSGKLGFVKHQIEIGDDYEKLVAAAPAELPPIRSREDDIAYLIYTSGTTGRPKGVMLSHRGQVRAAQILCIESCVEPTEVVAVAMPFYHIGAKITWLSHSWRGIPMILHRAFRPQDMMESIARHRVTATLMAPTMLMDALNLPDLDRIDHSSLTKIFYSAAPMPTALLKRGLAKFGRVFTQFYGATESGAPATTLHRHQHVLDGPAHAVKRLASAGQPMNGCEIRIVRADGTDCADGEPGEILIRSGALMLGYWNKPEATEEAFADGWLRSGDIGTFDDEGFVFIVDRKKDMIVSGGENIYSREVEEALMAHPDVAEAAVVGRPDPRWGEAVVAFVVRRPGSTVSAEAVEAHCRGAIAAYKRPKDINFVEALPKLPNGKIEKTKLREALARAET
jgi:acyl-CoA synthetase (AMP-forming)/AMP-acid ligase II